MQTDDDGIPLNWPTYVACEWDESDYCHIYGEATIVGGDGDPTKTCLAAGRITTIFNFYYYWCLNICTKKNKYKPLTPFFFPVYTPPASTTPTPAPPTPPPPGKNYRNKFNWIVI